MESYEIFCNGKSVPVMASPPFCYNFLLIQRQVIMAKRIFITGASGFIGKAVVERLLRDDHQLSLLYLPEEPAEKFSDLNIIRGEITRADTLAGKLSGHDTLIHIAGSLGYQYRTNLQYS